MSEVRVGLARQAARNVIAKYLISGPPVNVHDIAAKEGLSIQLMSSWPSKVSGLLLRDEKLIGLNAHHSHSRRRFSLAHELGHWFMRHDFPWHDQDVTIDNPPAMDADGKPPEEGEADEFAGELLAPLAFLKAAMNQNENPGALAAVFDMSEEALWVRILRHRLLK
jgi:Zn-dependent peptidase ImmA (M78 family)